MSWREEILQRNPIDEYLRREGYKVRLGRGSFLADDACPVATHKPGHPVRIDARNHRWRCDSCQQSGSVIEWVALKKGITAGEAKLELNGNELPPFVRVLIASCSIFGSDRRDL